MGEAIEVSRNKMRGRRRNEGKRWKVKQRRKKFRKERGEVCSEGRLSRGGGDSEELISAMKPFLIIYLREKVCRASFLCTT